MNSRWLLALILLGTGVSLAILLFGSPPLGIPSEWTWTRIELTSENSSEVLGNLLFALPAIFVWLWFVLWSVRRIDERNRTQRAFSLGLLTCLSFWLVSALQSIAPSPWPQLKGMVLYYPHSSGYFHKARYELNSVPEFLAGYENLMAEGDVGHLGTHPPGLFLLHRGLWQLCESSASWTRSLNATIPENVELAFDEIDANLRASASSLTQADRAALWLAMCLTQLIGVATLIPIYGILQRYVAPSNALTCAALWPLVPAMAIFLPKSDVLYPFFGVLFLWLWITATEKQFLLRSFLAGVVFWIGCTLSLAVVPWGLIAGVYSLQRLFDKTIADRVRLLLVPALSVGGFLILTGFAGAVGKINLFNTWIWNYHNHSQFYSPENSPRSWFGWLLVNPVETLFSLGVPLGVLMLAGSWRILVRLRRESMLTPRTEELRTLLLACLIVWGAIWLSGKNSGEAARLWLVFFPIACIGAAGLMIDRPSSSNEFCPAQRPSPLLWLLVLQLLACIVTVISVSGFHP